MLPKFLAVSAIAVAIATILAAYTQRSALVLRQQNQSNYWSRRGTSLSGRYHNNIWVVSPVRSSYGTFRGGGPGAGK